MARGFKFPKGLKEGSKAEQAMDRKFGVKEGSKADRALDKKMGVRNGHKGK